MGPIFVLMSESEDASNSTVDHNVQVAHGGCGRRYLPPAGGMGDPPQKKN